MSTFRTGDQVRLKSGGPQMSVEKIGNPPLVFCVWFEGDKLQRSHFEPAVLEKWADYEARCQRQADDWSRSNAAYDPLDS